MKQLRFSMSEVARQAIHALGMECIFDADTACLVFTMASKKSKHPVRLEAWDKNPIYSIARAALYLYASNYPESDAEFALRYEKKPAQLVPVTKDAFADVSLDDLELRIKELADMAAPKVTSPVFTATDYDKIEADVWKELESVELSVKGQVHREPNQNEDGTIGDTGRFL